MDQEILNIEHHVKILVLKALNRTANHSYAAKELGITERTLYRYKKNFGIAFNKPKNFFYFKGDKAVLMK